MWGRIVKEGVLSLRKRQMTTVVLKLEVVVNDRICALDEESENLHFSPITYDSRITYICLLPHQ